MRMFCSMLWVLEWCWNRVKMVGVYSGCCSMSFFCLACVEQWGRTDILAQASSSRPGKNISSSPRVLPPALAQARGCVLSDRTARPSETASPKRGIVKLSNDPLL